MSAAKMPVGTPAEDSSVLTPATSPRAIVETRLPISSSLNISRAFAIRPEHTVDSIQRTSDHESYRQPRSEGSTVCRGPSRKSGKLWQLRCPLVRIAQTLTAHGQGCRLRPG